MAGRGRPKAEAPKGHAVQARFDDQEHEAFLRLVAKRQEELRVEGARVNSSDVIRWLVAREVAARGLDRPPLGSEERPITNHKEGAEFLANERAAGRGPKATKKSPRRG